MSPKSRAARQSLANTHSANRRQTKKLAPRFRWRPTVELLEDRILLSGTPPDENETFSWFLINKMRQNPGQFADQLMAAYQNPTAGPRPFDQTAAGNAIDQDVKYAVDNNPSPGNANDVGQAHMDAFVALMHQFAPRNSPLAFNLEMQDGASTHVNWMANNVYGHSVAEFDLPLYATLTHGSNHVTEIGSVPGGFSGVKLPDGTYGMTSDVKPGMLLEEVSAVGPGSPGAPYDLFTISGVDLTKGNQSLTLQTPFQGQTGIYRLDVVDPSQPFRDFFDPKNPIVTLPDGSFSAPIDPEYQQRRDELKLQPNQQVDLRIPSSAEDIGPGGYTPKLDSLNLQASQLQAYQAYYDTMGYIIDWGNNPDADNPPNYFGHLKNLMAKDPSSSTGNDGSSLNLNDTGPKNKNLHQSNEIGIDIQFGVNTTQQNMLGGPWASTHRPNFRRGDVYHQDLGVAYLTGVAYNGNGWYFPGEGIGNVRVVATRKADGKSFSTTTWAAGGYSLWLPPGDYTVVATDSSGKRLETGRAIIDPIRDSSRKVATDVFANGLIYPDNVRFDITPGSSLALTASDPDAYEPNDTPTRPTTSGLQGPPIRSMLKHHCLPSTRRPMWTGSGSRRQGSVGPPTRLPSALTTRPGSWGLTCINNSPAAQCNWSPLRLSRAISNPSASQASPPEPTL
jgi:hypothetical protein